MRLPSILRKEPFFAGYHEVRSGLYHSCSMEENVVKSSKVLSADFSSVAL